MRTEMHDIDFLPAEYRRQHALRRRQPWRMIVLAAVGALMAGTSLVQHYRRTHVEAALAAIEARHDLAVRQSKQLATLQSQLLTARATAELFVYLRHPWPRTQILAEVLAPLPAEVEFDRLDIARRPPERALTNRRSRAEEKAEEAKLAALPAATRDLARLRRESDPMQTVVTLSGVTNDSAALHRYLAALEKSKLFLKVELSSIETAAGDPSRTLRFSAELILRPGYGQPGGPTGSDRDLLAGK